MLALSMLLLLIPLYGAAVEDEFAGFETIEEVPFEFELEPGDLPFELLKDAVLAAEDIPSCIVLRTKNHLKNKAHGSEIFWLTNVCQRQENAEDCILILSRRLTN